MNAMLAGSSRIESAALRRVRQERRRQLAVRHALSQDTAARYVPRHRADQPVDPAA